MEKGGRKEQNFPAKKVFPDRPLEQRNPQGGESDE